MTRALLGGWLFRLLLLAALSATGLRVVAEARADALGACECERPNRHAGGPTACPDACVTCLPAVVEASCERAAPAQAPERCVGADAMPPPAPPPDGVFHPPIR
jgi:hypothetical protein